MHQLSTPERLFDRLVRDQPARPFVTYYDEATGERSELSVRSLANWVAKTHFLLTDELGQGLEYVAYLQLPAHWISVAPLLGCLTAGMVLTDDPAEADVAFVDDRPRPRRVREVFAINPGAAAVGFRDAPPIGTVDFVSAVRPQGDTWFLVSTDAEPDDACLPGLTRAQAVTAAAERARELGLTEGGRLLTTRDWTGPEDWLSAVLAPLVVGGSLVIVRNADDATVERRAEQERATALLR